MAKAWRRGLAITLALAVVGMALGVGGEGSGGERAASLEVVLRANLKQLRDWLADDDLASAAQTADCMAALAQLMARQGADENWRKATFEFQQMCAKASSAARKKDGPASTKIAEELATRLELMKRSLPTGVHSGRKTDKLTGSTKTWMLLFDSTYVDAKSAMTGPALRQWAQALAEEADGVKALRADPRWQRWCDDIQKQALVAADKAPQDLEAARRELRKVNGSCEECHQKNRKK